MKYFQGTLNLSLKLADNDTNVIKWWVDDTFSIQKTQVVTTGP